MSKFEVGQRIKIKKSAGPLNRGKFGVITEFLYHGYDREASVGDEDRWAVQLDGEDCNTGFTEKHFELIQNYTPITPKVGERYRVKEGFKAKGCRENQYFPTGTITEYMECGFRDTCAHTNNYNWGVEDKYLTTEYLELVSEPGECITCGGSGECQHESHFTNCSTNCLCDRTCRDCDGKDTSEPEEETFNPTKTIKKVQSLAHENYYRMPKMETKKEWSPIFMGMDWGEEPIKKTVKLTTMQKLTSALKRILSKDQQTLYKANYINQGLELSNEGKDFYISALYRNEGDHKKAVTEMVEQATEDIKEEEK